MRSLLSLFLLCHLVCLSTPLCLLFISFVPSSVCVCVCALSRCARYFPFSHSHSVPCGVRALISYCYISSRVQMLTHMSVCVCYMLRHVNILSKIKASCLLKLFADTLPISHWFFLPVRRLTRYISGKNT